MASSSRIAILAAEIQENTSKVDAYLKENGIPSPSFSPDNPLHVEVPEEIAAAQNAVVDATDELKTLMLGPVPHLVQTAFLGVSEMISLHSVCRFNIAKTFETTTTVQELASLTKLDESDLRRILQHAVTNHIFSQPSKDTIAHTSLSRCLAEVPLFAPWIDSGLDWLWPGASQVNNAMQKWPGSNEPNQTALNLAHDTQEPFFKWISSSPQGAKKFADQMTFVQSSPGLSFTFLIVNYDWPSDGGTVVDVGGSEGAIMFELSKKFPNLKCIVQDLPEVLEGVQQTRENVQFQSHDFFTSQPVKNADVYVLRQILHDWSDEYCVEILRNLIPSLKDGARILVNDRIIPEPGSLPPRAERMLRGSDLFMKMMFNSRERTEADWTALLQIADERFSIRKISTPRGSELGILDVEWKDNSGD